MPLRLLFAAALTLVLTGSGCAVPDEAPGEPPGIAVEIAVPDLPAGTTVGVRGDTAPLSWDATLPLSDTDGDGVYTARIEFAEGASQVGYKAVIEAPGAEIRWEGGGNRLLLPGRMTADRRAFDAPQTNLPTPMLTRAEVAEDFAVLQSGLETLHPGLTLHNTPGEAARLFDDLDADAERLGVRYDDAIPLPAVYLAAARTVASVRDGHTQVSMYNQSALTTALLYTRPDRIPFTFRLIGDRMIVTGDATADYVLPAGTEVVTIDGRPIAEIVAALLPYASGDGARDADRRQRLEVKDLVAPAERFDVIYSLLFEPEGDAALTVRRPGEGVETVEVPRMTAVARRDTLWARDAALPRSQSDLLRYELLEDGTAYLKVGSFSTFNMERDYEAWLTDAFQQMKASRAERLVVDLRGCAGGMDDAAALLHRHLLGAPVTPAQWRGSTAYDRIPEALHPHIRSWTTDFFDLSGQVTAAENGTFQMPVRVPQALPPAPDAFDGPVAVLIDAAASSATFYLAKAIQETGTAVLVGQETGGSLKGLNAGQMAFLTLPHSGIVADVPLFASRPAMPGTDRGVVPEVVVPPDADAAIAGRDAELAAAIAHLRGD